jgi:hypothetical protein
MVFLQYLPRFCFIPQSKKRRVGENNAKSFSPQLAAIVHGLPPLATLVKENFRLEGTENQSVISTSSAEIVLFMAYKIYRGKCRERSSAGISTTG